MRKLILLVTALLPMAVMGQKSTLTLTLTGLEPGAGLVVSEALDGRLVPADTLYLDAKGTVKMTRQATEPIFFVLQPMTNRAAGLHCMLLPREKVTLDVDYRAEKNQFYMTSVKGSENMELYARFNNMMSDATDPTSLPDRIESLLRENKHLLMSAFLVTYFESAFEQYAPLYKVIRDALADRYGRNDFVRHLDQKLRSVVMVGMEAPIS